MNIDRAVFALAAVLGAVATAALVRRARLLDRAERWQNAQVAAYRRRHQ